jgi:molybdenum cofactor biosynthesis protein B
VSVDQHRAAAGTVTFGFAAITASDSRKPGDDLSGGQIRERALAAGHRVVESRLVPDEAGALRAAVVAALASPAVDVVVVTGGTGLAPRDVTIEAVAPLFEKTIDGFGELFRRLSWDEIGPAAMLSRAAAGVVAGKAVFLLPGSPAAVRLALERLVLPELAHLLAQARRAR